MSVSMTMPISKVTTVSSATGTTLTIDLTMPGTTVNGVNIPPAFPTFSFSVANPTAADLAAYTVGANVTMALSPAAASTSSSTAAS